MKRTSKPLKALAGLDPLEFWRNNRMLFALTALFALGMLAGASNAAESPLPGGSLVAAIFKSSVQIRGSQAFVTTFLNALLSSSPYLFVIFFMGLSAGGLPVILFIPFFKGLGLGMLSGFLYADHGMQGLAYCVLTVFPGAVLSVASLLFACREGARLSAILFSSMRKKGGPAALHGEIKIYAARFCVFGLIFIISALVDAGCNLLFLRFFHF